MADPKDGKVWDVSHKIWDGARPIHRINSPFWDTSSSRAGGDGYNHGCTKPPTERGADRLLHIVPAWVLVPGGPVREVEGKLVRSFQTWTDVPLYQWHRWYDWNFHVEPADGFKNVRGMGNEAPNVPGHTPIVPGDTIECEWDVGAFGLPSGQLEFGPGPMFNLVSESTSIDWAWPMTGQYIWLSGRWIYDCGHTNSAGLMRSELHPCKAVASARWEAAKFSASSKLAWPANGSVPTADTLFLPGIQFMFYANRRGGYVDFDKINDQDYEFIVDLPKIAGTVISAPIAPTPEAPLNTIVAGKLSLLYKFDFTQFQTKSRGTFATVDPVVTAIVPDDGTAPQQVKVKLPLTSLPANTDGYGVLISIGWYDAAGLTTKEVIKCVVRFKEMYFHEDRGDIHFKFGVNGRWFWGNFSNVKKLGNLQLNKTVEIYLPRHQPTANGGPLMVNSHGAAIKPTGEIMQNATASRTLHFVDKSWFDPPGVWRILPEIVRYQQDCVDANFDQKQKVRLAVEVYLGNTFGISNEALGIFDSNYGVNKDPANLNLPYTFPRAESVVGVEEVGTSAELVQTTSLDYELFWEASISLQVP
jgi:hypothetical protein